jgi:hypothetical protein
MVGMIKDEVEARLRIKHSPDQISKSLVLRELNVSHEAIYQHIANDRKAGGDLSLNLRINGRRRYRRRSKIGRGEKIPNRVDIEKRPPVVSRRKRYGEWEADLIQGGAGSGFLRSGPAERSQCLSYGAGGFGSLETPKPMKRKRRTHSAEFKARVALEALKGVKTIN